jgi:hypothetical protein
LPDFNANEWLILALVFLLGLILGMAAMAGGKWKHRYRDEARRREAAEAERSRMESQLRHAEARSAAATARDPVVVHDTSRDTPIA